MILPSLFSVSKLTKVILSNSSPSLEIDTSSLEKKFTGLQRKLHPDFFHNKSRLEHEYATNNSSLLNSAYQTLKDPLLRVLYYLTKKGVIIGEEDSTFTDPELLMEILESREAVEEAGLDDLHKIKEKNDVSLKNAFKEVQEADQKNDLVAAKQAAIKLQYLAKLAEEIYDRLPVGR
eukprot:TRINITY_DN1402_c0_g1_i1.p1 TRINITY_DN1402_c0_g1~~TRINITY_DN1402_c0_g1_i1.p1  ORF type:complete len:177 (-),score=48.38 TRINITY_DN1402_c0_g1_i1:16-546(-)